MIKISVYFLSVLLVAILITGFSIPAYSEYMSPKKQLESGIALEDVICKENHVLVLRSNHNIACVSERIAERTGWEIIKTEFIQTEKLVTIPEPTIAPEQVTPTIIMIDQSSDVEFVDDGREIFFSKLQASAPPRNYYNTIMTHLSNNDSVFSNDGNGVITVKSIPHEKYSVKEGVGLYLEDWLPEFIPEGQRLLYSTNMYHENGKYYRVTHIYVPTTFELTPEFKTSDFKKTKGFTVTVNIKTDTPFPSLESYKQRHTDTLETQDSNVGGYVDMTRDGKYVKAYSGSNKYNHYQAIISFAPDEYTIVGVNSNYHTLDELLPIFESVMKENKESITPSTVIDSFDVLSYNFALHGSVLYDYTLVDYTFTTSSEAAVNLNHEKILYGTENYLTVAYHINDIPKYRVMDSDGNYLLHPSTTFKEDPDSDGNYLLHPSTTFKEDPDSDVSRGFHLGYAYFGKTWEPGEYTVIVTMNNTEIKKNFTITDSDCCDLLLQSVPDMYNPGDDVSFYRKTTIPLTISLINPDGETRHTKIIDKMLHTGFSIKQSIALPEKAIPGIWTLEATDGKRSNSVQLLVIPPLDVEGILGEPTAMDILASYHEALANKKPGHDILLVSSLEPFDDDGREYPRSRGIGGGHQKNVYNDISYIMKSSPFSVNDKGIVTIQSTDHERYSVQKGGGFYLEDWLPTHIPDGYKLLYAKTNDNPFLNFNYKSMGNSMYQFVPVDYVLSGVTYRDFDFKIDGFKISVYRSTELNPPMEEIISSTKKDRETKKQLETHPRFAGTYSYGGFVDMTRDGKTVYAFEGSNSFGAHKTTLIFHPDEYTRVIVSSFYLTMDELLPVFDSVMK